MSDKITVTNIKMKNQGSLILQCDVIIHPWKMTMKEVKYFVKGESKWLGMPSRSWKDNDEWKSMDLTLFHDADAKEAFRVAVVDKIMIELEQGVNEKPIFDEDLPF